MVILASLEAFLVPPGAFLAASWGLFGRSRGGLGLPFPLPPALEENWGYPPFLTFSHLNFTPTSHLKIIST